MENFPSFNYNTGIYLCEYCHLCIQYDLLTFVLCVLYSGAYPQLGSTIMGTMLDEVNEFCRMDRRKEWSQSTLQQVCYMLHSLLRNGGLGAYLLNKFTVYLNWNRC